jgi:uncharacterized membrane protein
MIFGLALSLGAIGLVANPPTSSATLYTDLATFGFSFLILIVVWLAYTRLMMALTLERLSTLHLNVALLFVVSIEPFLLNVLVRPNLTADFFAAVSQAYAVDVATMLVLLGLFGWALATSKNPSLPDRLRRTYRSEALNRWFAAGLFFVSAVPVFEQVRVFGEPVRVVLWVVAVGIVWATRAGWMNPRSANEPG